jgi:hypothetical protein
VARAVHEAPTVAGGVRRTADLPTADGQVSLATGPAALTVPGKGRADVATAPTLRVTPPGAPARGRPGVATAPTIASYWSDSNPSIVVAELPGASGDVGPDVRSARPRAGPLRAATLGVRLPTPADPMPAVAPSTMSRWSRLAVIVGGGLAGAALLVGGTYLLTRPAPEQPLSVGTTGLVRSPEPTPRPAATPATRPIAPGRDSMIWKVHPGDTKLLLRLSQDQLRGSEVYKTLLETTKTPLKIPQLAVLQKACGIDLLDRVDWLSIGLSGTPDRLGVDFMLHGSWTRDELERCVTRLGESAGLAWTLKRHGPVTRVVLGSSAFWIGWPDPKTLFLSNRDIADRPWVTARLAGRRAAREDSGLRRMYDYVPTGVTAWVVMSSMAVVKDSVFDALPRPSTAVVSLRVSSELTLVAVARYDTDARALQARDAIRIRLHKLKRNTFVDSLLTRAEVTGTGRQVRVSFFLERASALLFAQALSSYLESADLSAVTPHGTKREGAAPSKP